jgi:hypothetical protein
MRNYPLYHEEVIRSVMDNYSLCREDNVRTIMKKLLFSLYHEDIAVACCITKKSLLIAVS